MSFVRRIKDTPRLCFIVGGLYPELRDIGPEEKMTMRDEMKGWRFSNILERYNYDYWFTDFRGSGFTCLRVSNCITEDEDIGTLVQLKLTLNSFESLCRSSGGSNSSGSLLTSVIHLEPGKNSVSDNRSYTNQFGGRFPPRRLWIPAFCGLIVGWWGWHNLRNDRRLSWGTIAFLSGIILWGYEVYRFVEWSR